MAAAALPSLGRPPSRAPPAGHAPPSLPARFGAVPACGAFARPLPATLSSSRAAGASTASRSTSGGSVVRGQSSLTLLPRRQRTVFASASADAASDNSDALDAAARDALLLCWFGAQRRSLFATRCLAEVVLELYRRGVPPASPLTSLALARLSSGGAALGEQPAAVLASWVTLAFMTLEEIGAARYPGVDDGGVPRAGDGSATDAGMRGFARHTVTRFAGGAGARRLLTAQVLASAGGEVKLEGTDGGGRDGGPTPTPAPGGGGGMAALMQANARICVLTLDAARGAGVEVGVPLDRLERAVGGGGEDGEEEEGEEEEEQSAPFGPPVGFAAGALPPLPGAPPLHPAAASRARAARLLLAFLGAAGMAAADPAAAFVATAAEAYRAGESAAGALSALRPDELASAGADAALPIAVASTTGAGGGGEGPGAALLRQWVSIVYMALALKGVPHSAAASSGSTSASGGDGLAAVPAAGWAFAGDPSTGGAEAYGLARVVAGALETEGEADGGGGAAAPKSPAVLLASAAAARARGAGADLKKAAAGGGSSSSSPTAPSFVVLEDADLGSTSAALGIVRQQVGLAVAAGALVDAKAAEWGLVEA